VFFYGSKVKKMSDDQPTPIIVVRDNTGILLLLLLFVFVTMVLLTVTLVRLGSLDRKVGQLRPPPPRPLRAGAGDSGVDFFYVR